MSSFVISADIKIQDEEQKEHVQNMCRQFSNMFRCGYNEISKGNSKKDTEHKLYNYENIQTLDYHFVRCAINKADGLYSTHKTQFAKAMKSFEKSKDKNKIKPRMHVPIFGTRKKFKERAEGKITSEEWKQERIYMLESVGEEANGGNRKFKLDIENNQLIFKPKCGIKIPIKFVGLRRTYIEKLKYIQDNGKCFSVRLDDKRINITIDVENFVEPPHKVLNQRVMGIDLNPDNIGYSITDQPSGKIIKAECFDLSNLTVKSGKPSEDPESKYLTNKRNYEILQIVHSLIKTAIHFQVKKISVEELNFSFEKKSKEKSAFNNKFVNRKNKNCWPYRLFIDKIKMLGIINNIEIVEIHPAYTSMVGNVCYDFVDPVNASLEIGRRGFHTSKKGKFYKTDELEFYPNISSLKQHWKQTVSKSQNWNEFLSELKSLNCRYRVSLDDENCQVFVRHFYKKKNISLYSFI
jgi:IS605 OrfB family transposase